MPHIGASAPARLDARFAPLSVWRRTLGISGKESSACAGPDRRLRPNSAGRPCETARADVDRFPKSSRPDGLGADKRDGDGPLAGTSIGATISGSGLSDACLVAEALVGVATVGQAKRSSELDCRRANPQSRLETFPRERPPPVRRRGGREPGPRPHDRVRGGKALGTDPTKGTTIYPTPF
jgi:hypothetical protein